MYLLVYKQEPLLDFVVGVGMGPWVFRSVSLCTSTLKFTVGCPVQVPFKKKVISNLNLTLFRKVEYVIQSYAAHHANILD